MSYRAISVIASHRHIVFSNIIFWQVTLGIRFRLMWKQGDCLIECLPAGQTAGRVAVDLPNPKFH